MAEDLAMGPADTSLRTLSRAMTLLQTLAAKPAMPQKLSALSAATGLHRATAHRLLAALIAEGMVEDSASGYLLGAQAWLIGRAASTRFDLMPLAEDLLNRIAERTGDVVLLAILVGFESRCIGRVVGDYLIHPSSLRVGSVRPLGCTAHSLALLAALSDEDIGRAIAATAAIRAAEYPGITDDELRKRVAATRANGFALAEGDVISGQSSLAVVIRDPWRRPVAALSFNAITERLLPPRRPEIEALLREATAVLEARLRAPSSAPSHTTQFLRDIRS